jgi:hypothetical protein
VDPDVQREILYARVRVGSSCQPMHPERDLECGGDCCGRGAEVAGEEEGTAAVARMPTDDAAGLRHRCVELRGQVLDNAEVGGARQVTRALARALKVDEYDCGLLPAGFVERHALRSPSSRRVGFRRGAR